MNYIIRLMNRSEIKITQGEYKNLAGKSGLVFIPSQDRMVNINSITEVLSEEVAKKESEIKFIDIDEHIKNKKIICQD